MPLPPALLARLAKRGLVKEQPQPPPPQKTEDVEEVFAEDYDDPAKPEPATETKVTPEDPDSGVEDDEQHIYEVTACPNRSNPYHVCVKYCKNRWGLKLFTPDTVMLSRRDRMLRKYPLPDGWKEVADPDTNRYYYWSVQTDQVCWLSPGHPRAEITMSAEKLQAAAAGRGLLTSLDDDVEEAEEDAENMDDDKMSGDSDLSDSLSDTDSEEERRRARSQRERDMDRRGGRSRGSWREDNRRGRKRRDDLDPMDPAAYSDIPRGGWTDGLDTRGSAKTGVDVTASGPLFQQRPYPSPGDILRANQQSKRKPAT